MGNDPAAQELTLQLWFREASEPPPTGGSRFGTKGPGPSMLGVEKD